MTEWVHEKVDVVVCSLVCLYQSWYQFAVRDDYYYWRTMQQCTPSLWVRFIFTWYCHLFWSCLLCAVYSGQTLSGKWHQTNYQTYPSTRHTNKIFNFSIQCLFRTVLQTTNATIVASLYNACYFHGIERRSGSAWLNKTAAKIVTLHKLRAVRMGEVVQSFSAVNHMARRIIPAVITAWNTALHVITVNDLAMRGLITHAHTVLLHATPHTHTHV